MKLFLLSILSLFLFSSCAHHHKSDGGHHHHKCEKNCEMHSDNGEVFNKHCAMSLAMGDSHVAGNEDYKIIHHGETYYFSSEEKMNKFKENIEQNIERANRFWTAGDRR